MPRIYTTKQNEMIDAICRQFYGDESGYVEQVLEVNPGLADAPSPLSMGLIIKLPALLPATSRPGVINLWD